uniref:Tick transposon n=1 Tax=Parascaris univalens TaxID=6257 RepID=A0A915CKM8_PARUN
HTSALTAVVKRQTERKGKRHDLTRQVCAFCNEAHWADVCLRFTTLKERFDRARQLRLCLSASERVVIKRTVHETSPAIIASAWDTPRHSVKHGIGRNRKKSRTLSEKPTLGRFAPWRLSRHPNNKSKTERKRSHCPCYSMLQANARSSRKK